MRKLYTVLAAVAFAVALSQMILFVRDYGLDLRVLMTQALATPGASLFTYDVLAASLAFWVFVYSERGVARWWMYVVLTLVVGLSFALPLFLLAHESRVK